VIGYTPEAIDQVDSLIEAYEQKGRIEASYNLQRALRDAEARLERDPSAGLPAPRPYPDMARPGLSWIKMGRYWIAYSRTTPPVITGVFYDQSNIPRRV
jgi:hypothetical protein